MITALIIFGLSFAGMSFVMLNRAHFAQVGKFYIPVKDSWNTAVENFLMKVVFFATEFPKHAVRESFHFLVIKSVELARKARALIYPRISHIMDTVKGKDVPKVQGEASEFLRSINKEEEK